LRMMMVESREKFDDEHWIWMQDKYLQSKREFSS